MTRALTTAAALALLLLAGLSCARKESAADEKQYVCSMPGCGKEKSAPADAPDPS